MEASTPPPEHLVDVPLTGAEVRAAEPEPEPMVVDPPPVAALRPPSPPADPAVVPVITVKPFKRASASLNSTRIMDPAENDDASDFEWVPPRPSSKPRLSLSTKPNTSSGKILSLSLNPPTKPAKLSSPTPRAQVKVKQEPMSPEPIVDLCSDAFMEPADIPLPASSTSPSSHRLHYLTDMYRFQGDVMQVKAIFVSFQSRLEVTEQRQYICKIKITDGKRTETVAISNDVLTSWMGVSAYEYALAMRDRNMEKLALHRQVRFANVSKSI